MQNHSLEEEIYSNRRMMWQGFTKYAARGCIVVILLLLFLTFIFPGV